MALESNHPAYNIPLPSPKGVHRADCRELAQSAFVCSCGRITEVSWDAMLQCWANKEDVNCAQCGRFLI